MSVFKPLKLLILSAVSYNLALHAPSSPTTEDEVMGTSFCERIWKRAAIPTTIYIKVLSTLTSDRPRTHRAPDHTLDSRARRVGGHRGFVTSGGHTVPVGLKLPSHTVFGSLKCARARGNQSVDRHVRDRHPPRYLRRDYPLAVLPHTRRVLHRGASHSQGSPTYNEWTVRGRATSGLCQPDDVHRWVVSHVRHSGLVVDHVEGVERVVGQGRSRCMVFSYGGVGSDTVSSRNGGGSFLVGAIWD